MNKAEILKYLRLIVGAVQVDNKPEALRFGEYLVKSLEKDVATRTMTPEQKKEAAEKRKQEKEAQRLRKLRDRYRRTVCSGCHSDRYNYTSDGDRWNAPTSGTGCWNLGHIKRGKCSSYYRR